MFGAEAEGEFAAHRLPLSQTEWMLVAYYCQLGAEAFEDSMPNQISDESLAGILEAFLAVYDLHPAKRTPTDLRCIANLPVDEKIGKKKAIEIECEDVRYLAKKTIQALKNPASLRRRPLLAARNFFTVLDTTVFPSMEMLNEALLPHWTIYGGCVLGDSTSITASPWLTSHRAFRNLVRRAWEHPEVRRLWNDMALRYGEF